MASLRCVGLLPFVAANSQRVSPDRKCFLPWTCIKTASVLPTCFNFEIMIVDHCKNHHIRSYLQDRGFPSTTGFSHIYTLTRASLKAEVSDVFKYQIVSKQDESSQSLFRPEFDYERREIILRLIKKLDMNINMHRIVKLIWTTLERENNICARSRPDRLIRGSKIVPVLALT